MLESKVNEVLSKIEDISSILKARLRKCKLKETIYKLKLERRES